MIFEKQKLISIFTVVAVWSITLTFFLTLFWAIAVIFIAAAIYLLTQTRSQFSSFKKSSLMKISMIVLICLIQFLWGAANNFYNVEIIVFLIIGTSLAVLLTQFRASSRLSWLPFYVTAFIFLFALVLGLDPEDLLAKNSRNFLSVILLGLFASAIILSKPRYVTRNHFVAAAILLVVSVISVGRSGILFSCLLLLCLGTKAMLDGRRTFSKVLRNGILIALVLALGALLAETLLGFAPRLVSRGFQDYSRLTINIAYFSNISLEQLVFGRNYFEIPFLAKFGYNLHNSYLSTWANLGIGYLALVVFCVFKACFRAGQFPFLWIPVLALGGRAATDIQMIGAKYDYIFLVVFFLQKSSQTVFEPKRTHNQPK